MLEARRKGDQRRVVSSQTSKEEALRLSDSAVLLRGLEHSIAPYCRGLPRKGQMRWSALWIRGSDAAWRLIAESATPVRESDTLSFVAVPQGADLLATRVGRWQPDLPMPLELAVRTREGHLVASGSL